MTREADWSEFDAIIEVMPWGRNVYTIIRVAPSLEAAAKADRTRRVEGTIEDAPVNLGINRADVIPDAFMYVGKGMRRRLHVEPGDVVSCRLRPADPDEVPLPEDVHQALAEADLLGAFQSKRPADRRRLLHGIAESARPATRQKRIEALLQSLPPS